MRYRKGSIALSSMRDYLLLRQVLHAGFVTHDQLFEFLRLEYCVSSRNAFNNRVLRLVKHGLLIRHEQPLINCEAVYSVSRLGVLELESGEPFTQSFSKNRSTAAQRLLHHSLELNEIHLALKRTGSLIHWTPETEIR